MIVTVYAMLQSFKFVYKFPGTLAFLANDCAQFLQNICLLLKITNCTIVVFLLVLGKPHDKKNYIILYNVCYLTEAINILQIATQYWE